MDIKSHQPTGALLQQTGPVAMTVFASVPKEGPVTKQDCGCGCCHAKLGIVSEVAVTKGQISRSSSAEMSISKKLTNFNSVNQITVISVYSSSAVMKFSDNVFTMDNSVLPSAPQVTHLLNAMQNIGWQEQKTQALVTALLNNTINNSSSETSNVALFDVKYSLASQTDSSPLVVGSSYAEAEMKMFMSLYEAIVPKSANVMMINIFFSLSSELRKMYGSSKESFSPLADLVKASVLRTIESESALLQNQVIKALQFIDSGSDTLLKKAAPLLMEAINSNVAKQASAQGQNTVTDFNNSGQSVSAVILNQVVVTDIAFSMLLASSLTVENNKIGFPHSTYLNLNTAMQCAKNLVHSLLAAKINTSNYSDLPAQNLTTSKISSAFDTLGQLSAVQQDSLQVQAAALSAVAMQILGADKSALLPTASQNINQPVHTGQQQPQSLPLPHFQTQLRQNKPLPNAMKRGRNKSDHSSDHFDDDDQQEFEDDDIIFPSEEDEE